MAIGGVNGAQQQYDLNRLNVQDSQIHIGSENGTTNIFIFPPKEDAVENTDKPKSVEDIEGAYAEAAKALQKYQKSDEEPAEAGAASEEGDSSVQSDVDTIDGIISELQKYRDKIAGVSETDEAAAEEGAESADKGAITSSEDVFENVEPEAEYTNKRLNELGGEDVYSTITGEEYETAGVEDQIKAFNELIGDPQEEGYSLSYNINDDGEVEFFYKRENEDGSTEYMKVVENEDDEQALVHTTVEKGAKEGTTEIYDMDDIAEADKATEKTEDKKETKEVLI